MSSRTVVSTVALLAIDRAVQLLHAVAAAAATHSLITHITIALLIWAAVMAIWAMMHWSRVEPVLLRILSLPGEIWRYSREPRASCEAALPRAQAYNAAGDYEQTCLTLLRARGFPLGSDMAAFTACLQEARDGMQLPGPLHPEVIDELDRYISLLQQLPKLWDTLRSSNCSPQDRANFAAWVTTLQKQRSRVEDLLNLALEQQVPPSSDKQ